MNRLESLQQEILFDPKVWLITGVAGFIGSNLLETLLRFNQKVIGLDNYSTGYRFNLDDVQRSVTDVQWSNFKFFEGDICDLDTCHNVCGEADYVLHQAALGSVPRSVQDPLSTNRNNIDGFLNMLIAARDAGVKRFVYAASSSTYGDNSDLPKIENKIGSPLSPYALTKLVNELYAEVFSKTYGLSQIGLRYFNVFGRRQDPNGAYAAVIPRWIASMIEGESVFINGDGETSRDFCYVDNVVQCNLLAAIGDESAANQVYNVAVGERTSLNQLYLLLRESLADRFKYLKNAEPIYRDFRTGDVRHSLADIGKATKFLRYQPTHRISRGLDEAMDWYVNRLSIKK